MNDLPRHTLARIIAEDGREICASPKRIEALLRDLCGQYRREINIIVGALEERVAADLIAAGNAVPREALLARLAARLRDNLAYTPEAARWGVETWAIALGIISEAELQASARKQSAEAQRSNATPPVSNPKPPPEKTAPQNSQNSQASQRNSPPSTQPQRGTTYAPAPPPPQPSKPPKKSAPPPQIVRAPAPVAPRRTQTVHPNVFVPKSPPQNVAPPLPTQKDGRRGLTLRGCFIFVVLVIVLIVAAVFVVPVVIQTLREEQAQPSINDPRIR